MIEREYNKFIPYCDECEAQLPETDSFDDAIAELKKERWHFSKIGSEWIHKCPKCVARDDFT